MIERIDIGDRVRDRISGQRGVVVRIQVTRSGVTLAYVRLDVVPTAQGERFDVNDLELVDD